MKKLITLILLVALSSCSIFKSASVNTNNTSTSYTPESGTSINHSGNSNINYSKESGLNGTINIGNKQSSSSTISN